MKLPVTFKKPLRKKFLQFTSASLAALMLAVTAAPLASLAADYPTATVNTTGLAVTDDTVTVGQLHSATGTMAISETGSIQAEQLAIEQINAMGGVLGRKIKIIVEDGASDWPTSSVNADRSKNSSRSIACGFLSPSTT